MKFKRIGKGTQQGGFKIDKTVEVFERPAEPLEVREAGEKQFIDPTQIEKMSSKELFARAAKLSRSTSFTLSGAKTADKLITELRKQATRKNAEEVLKLIEDLQDKIKVSERNETGRNPDVDRISGWRYNASQMWELSNKLAAKGRLTPYEKEVAGALIKHYLSNMAPTYEIADAMLEKLKAKLKK